MNQSTPLRSNEIMSVLDRPSRLQTFSSAMLARTEDAALQAIVREASEAAGFPLASVSLVLRRTQFFRAHVGLPRDLAESRATDRDASFCQFVVGSGAPLVVQDAYDHDFLPREVTDLYGIRAYVGLPLTVRGEVVGTLCVLDVKPNQLSPQAFERLEALAEAAGARLSELEAQSPVDELLSVQCQAAEPAFAELRNLLAVLSAGVHMAKLARQEAEPARRLLRAGARGELTREEVSRNLDILHRTVASEDELDDILGDLSSTTPRLTETVLAVEALLRTAGTDAVMTAMQLMKVAGEVAHHVTKVAGGVRWELPSQPFALLSRSVQVTATVAVALRRLAEAVHAARASGIQVRVERTCATSLRVRLGICSPEAEPVCARVRAVLQSTLATVADVSCSVQDQAIVLDFANLAFADVSGSVEATNGPPTART